LSFNSKKKHKEKNDHLDDEVEEVYGRPGCILEISTLNSGSHRSPVECIALAGNYLVSGSEDHTIRIWRIYRANRKDSEDSEKKMQLIAQCIHILEGHCDSIMNLRFSPSYNILFSASADSTIRMWYVPPFDDECFFDEYKDPSNPDSPTVSRARSLSRSRGEIVNPFCIRVLEGHSSEVISLDIIEWPSPKEISSPKEKDGNESSSSLRITILSGSTDGYLGLWHF
jgi:WD40 repeat protein